MKPPSPGMFANSRELVDPDLVVVPMPLDARRLRNVLGQQLERRIDRPDSLTEGAVRFGATR